MISARDTVLKLAWLGVVLLIVGEIALVEWVQWYYKTYHQSAPLVLFWARTLMCAAAVVCCMSFVAFILSTRGARNTLAGIAVLIASLVVSVAVIGINALA